MIKKKKFWQLLIAIADMPLVQQDVSECYNYFPFRTEATYACKLIFGLAHPYRNFVWSDKRCVGQYGKASPPFFIISILNLVTTSAECVFSASSIICSYIVFPGNKLRLLDILVEVPLSFHKHSKIGELARDVKNSHRKIICNNKFTVMSENHVLWGTTWTTWMFKYSRH